MRIFVVNNLLLAMIILLGGATGRDGCGGATGSSKEHDINSAAQCSAEVQKALSDC